MFPESDPPAKAAFFEEVIEVKTFYARSRNSQGRAVLNWNLATPRGTTQNTARHHSIVIAQATGDRSLIEDDRQPAQALINHLPRISYPCQGSNAGAVEKISSQLYRPIHVAFLVQKKHASAFKLAPPHSPVYDNRIGPFNASGGANMALSLKGFRRIMKQGSAQQQL